MRISLIVAVSENGVIGREGDLPWHLSADLRRFKALTMGHHIIMGRRTFESIGRLLPGRTTVIVTRQSNYDGGGALIASGISDAIQFAVGDDEVFICGGAQVYRESIEEVDRIYLTRVHAHVDGETRFPDLDWPAWKKTEDTRHAADDRSEFDHSFQVYDRIDSR